MRTRASLESYIRAVIGTHASSGGFVLDREALRRTLLLEVTRWLGAEASVYYRNGRRAEAVIIRQLAQNIYDR